MNKKIKKVISIFSLILIIFLIITSVSDAAITDKFQGTTNPEGADKISSVLGSVLKIVRLVGAGIAVLILSVLGTKYMIASAGERAEIKKYAVVYVIGAVVLVASTTIIDLLVNFATEVTKKS